MNETAERRMRVWAEMQGLMADTKDRPMTGEEVDKYGGMESELRSLTATLETRRRQAELSKVMETSTGIPVPPGEVNAAEDQTEYRNAFLSYARGGGHGRDLLEARAMSVGIDTAGGFLVPDTFLARLQETLLAFGGIRPLADQITTSTGADIIWPTMGDTGVGEIVSENTPVTQLDETVGSKTLRAYMYSSKEVRISRQLVQDNTYDLEGRLSRRLGRRIAKLQAENFITGTGSGQPQGILKATADHVGASATDVTVDEMIDMIYALDRTFRAGSVFLMNDATVASIRKKKDSQGQYLWQASVQAGQPDSILGYPIRTDTFMPTMAAGAKSIIFGNIAEAYLIRDVAGASVLRLNERYADQLQVAFLGYQRMDAMVIEPLAYRQFRNA